MKRTFKRTMALLMSVASVAVGMTGLSANAYQSKGDWSVYYVKGAPGSTGLNPSCTVQMYTYGGGYQSDCDSITGSNDRYVQVTESGMSTYNITAEGTSAKKTSTTTGTYITFKFLGCSSTSTCKANGTMGYYG